MLTQLLPWLFFLFRLLSLTSGVFDRYVRPSRRNNFLWTAHFKDFQFKENKNELKNCIHMHRRFEFISKSFAFPLFCVHRECITNSMDFPRIYTASQKEINVYILFLFFFWRSDLAAFPAVFPFPCPPFVCSLRGALCKEANRFPFPAGRCGL